MNRFSDSQVLEIAKVLGDTGSGFTGTEIARLLGECGLPDPGPLTKRERIRLALVQAQHDSGDGRPIAQFVESAMDPVRYRANKILFDDRRHDLNVVLSFAGMHLREDGKLATAPPASTLTEAQRRSSALRTELARRGISREVLKYCRPELLEGNYFHAVFEATKSVAQRLRDLTGLKTDGSQLVEDALSIRGGRQPRLAWNRLGDDNDRSEHRGIALLISGTFSYFRNLPAHAPKLGFRNITEAEALELLTITSFIHRRLGEAVSTSPATGQR